jgi:hypothetical protein
VQTEDLVRIEPDISNLTKFRVDVYNPSDHDSLIKRVYIYATDKDDARQQMFNDIPANIKRKYGIVDDSSIEVMKVR